MKAASRKLQVKRKAIQIVLRGHHAAGYKPGEQVRHRARSRLPAESYDKASGNYIFKKSDKSSYASFQMASLIGPTGRKISIVSIEDGMAEDDWAGWKS